MNILPQDNTPRKQCKGPCGRTLPVTAEYFCKHKEGRNGLSATCKQCINAKYASTVPSKPAKHIPPNSYRYCAKCESDFPATLEYFRPSTLCKSPLFATCKQCEGEYGKAYRGNNLDKSKIYRKEHREEHRTYNAQYRQDHYDEINERTRLYRQDHADEYKQHSRMYRQTEQGRIVHRTSEHKRRSRKRNVGGTFTTEELKQQFARQKGRCYYCDVKLDTYKRTWHADHVIPLSRGGSNSIDNIVVACPTCNISKKDKMPWEFSKGGRLL